MVEEIRNVEELDDYDKAAAYLIDRALTAEIDGGFMLRAIKTLLDAVKVGD